MQTLATVLAAVALLAALAALVLVLGVRRRLASPGLDPDALPEDVQGLRQEVAALRAEANESIRHLAVVRYDAFGDMGGHLSWSLAVVDDSGSGIVLTSIHGRSDSRTYAKTLRDWVSSQPLSPEEEEAIRNARAAS